MSQLRPTAAAGLFYPSDKDKLKKDVEWFLSIGDSDKKFNHVTGLVAPHAGYIYSGRTAAIAYNTIKNKHYKNVIIISPSHREYFPGISIYSGDGYVTPLGIAEINKDLSNKLTEGSKTIFKGLEGHRQEHGVEVQIPFLQSILHDFQIVPVVMGDQSKIYIDELAAKIASVLDEDTLIVASSDLSHFYSRHIAHELDSVIEKRINSYDYEGLYNDLHHKRCEACGGGPIVSMMKSIDQYNKTKSLVLNRTDSGEASGSVDEVVGYLSAVFYN